MKKVFINATLLVMLIAIIFGMLYAIRMFSNVSTPITLYAPKPGITCAVIVTVDGAAISCWKD